MPKSRSARVAAVTLSGVLAACSMGVICAEVATAGTDPSESLSGNSIKSPINAPLNICGNTVMLLGDLRPEGVRSCSKRPSDSVHRSLPPTIVAVPIVDPVLGGVTAAGMAAVFAGVVLRRRAAAHLL